MAIAKTVKRKR